MVGTKSKGSKTKSKALVVVHDQPEPLNVINAEADDGPDDGDGHEDDQMTDEMNDEEEGTGFAINDMIVEGNETEEEEEEDVSDGGDAVTDSDVDNRNDGANEAEIEEEPVSCGSDDEDVKTEEEGEEEPEEDMSDGGDTVTNVAVENNADRANEETEEDEEPVSFGSDDEDMHTGEEEEPEEEMSDEGDTVTNVDVKNNNDKPNEEAEEDEPVSFGSDDEDVHTGEENDEGHVLVGNSTDNLDDNKEANELNAEEQISIPAEDGKDESIKEIASTANEIKTVAEKVVRQKKKIIRRILVKKKITPGKAVAGKNEGSEGSSVSSKAVAVNEAKPQSLEDNKAIGEENVDGQTESLKNEEKMKGKPIVKVNKKQMTIRKKKPQGQSRAQTGSKPTKDDPASKENQSIEQEIAKEGAGKSKAGFGPVDSRKNKKVLEEGTQKVNAEDIDKPGSSKSRKSSKKIDSQGMIFICSSDTKKDCYRYKVFGLPAAKKDVVAKIYKGMRLFLFDVDLKMLYGIYKAAAAGSYNVEPEAFKSRFPSQVRFTVLKDYLPIAEEKFKRVIKDNYYTNTKFNGQLNSEQVKNLCKLFNETKKSEPKRGLQSRIPITPLSTRVNRKRKQAEDRSRAEPRAISSQDHERKRKSPEEVRHTRMVRDREGTRRARAVRDREEIRRAPAVRGHDEIRRAPAVRGRKETRRALAVRGREETRRAPAVRGREVMRRTSEVRGHEETRRAVVVRGQEAARFAPVETEERYRRPVVFYDREAYLPPIESSSLYQPVRAEDPVRSRIYSYERDPEVDTYRRDSAISYRDPGITGSRESRQHIDQIVRDPYATYREHHVYREPVRETDTRREQYSYSSAERHYRSDDYQHPLNLHRRY
ncbi:hypothetical protein RND81_01G011700 [Saponaria officinalis]|uniref:DCD domain-containing protein n=1 Tax=Saponaria officinalis TaxID=3572 RepID=A0AAW1ND68_SAPOF